MIVEGVNFFDNEVIKWKKKDFIESHKKTFFLDREEFERERILSDVYDRISQQSKGKKIEGDGGMDTLL